MTTKLSSGRCTKTYKHHETVTHTNTPQWSIIILHYNLSHMWSDLRTADGVFNQMIWLSLETSAAENNEKNINWLRQKKTLFLLFIILKKNLRKVNDIFLIYKMFFSSLCQHATLLIYTMNRPWKSLNLAPRYLWNRDGLLFLNI